MHSTELRDIMQFGSNNIAVFFKMQVVGVLHIFQFETKQVLACSGTLYSSQFLILAFRLDSSSLHWSYFILLVFYHSLKGEEICVALQTHINDVMLRCYSKARYVMGGSLNEDTSNDFKPSSNLELSEKRLQELSKIVEESQMNADQVSLCF